MNPTARTVRRALDGLVLFAAVVALGSCGSDAGGSDALEAVSSTTTSTTSPVFIEDTSPDSSDSVPAEEPASTDDPTDDPTDDIAGGDDGGTGGTGATTPPDGSPTTVADQSGAPATASDPCLVGTWRVQDQPLLDALVRAVDEVGQIESVAPRGGQFVFVFADDGSFVARREAWSFGLGTIQGTIVTTISTDESGTFTAADGQLGLDSAPPTPSVSVQLEEPGGTVREVPAGETVVIGADPVAGSGAYTCNDASLTLSLPTAQGGVVTATADRTGS